MAGSQILEGIELFLFDLDGVFLAGKKAPRPLSGRRIIPALRERGIPFRVVTNTSTHPREYLAGSLNECGIDVAADEIHAALEVTIGVAARRFANGRCFVVGEAGVREAAASAGLQVVESPPADVVVVGLSRFADYRMLSLATRCLRGGAQLLGCHRNRTWMDDDGPAISCGPLLACLEHAAEIEAETFGKPSAAFYKEALRPFGLFAEKVAMVGDDPRTDVKGAQALGMRGILVLTGKVSRADLPISGVEPDLVLAEVDDLVELLPAKAQP